MKRSTGRFVVLVALAAAMACAWKLFSRRDKFAEFGQFATRPLDPTPTGSPGGGSQWAEEQLPTFYPQIPGFTNTLPPDPGFRKFRTPSGKVCKCPVPNPKTYRDSARDTVCAKSTGQAFSSQCAAECNGFTAKQLYPCKPLWALYRMG